MSQSVSRPTELAAGADNAVAQMLALLGDEWTMLVIQQALRGTSRYGQFLEELPISNSVLTKRLGALTDAGLLTRQRYQDRPPRDEYLPTARSRSLWPVLLSIWECERHWVGECRTLPGMRHLTCGADFAPVFICGACGTVVGAADVLAERGPSGSWRRAVPAVPSRRRPETDQRERTAALFPHTMGVLGNRWACAILLAAFAGATRFSDFQTALAAPPASIADRLQTLRTQGILTTADDQREYRLTSKGEAFLPVLVLAVQWAQRWFLAPEGPSVILTHTACRQALVGVLHCDKCERRLTGSSIDAVEPEYQIVAHRGPLDVQD